MVCSFSEVSMAKRYFKRRWMRRQKPVEALFMLLSAIISSPAI